MITPAYSMTATERVLPRLALDFTTGVLDPRVTVTRALNTATAVNSSGFIAVVNADLPRFDFDPVTLASKGLLIEEARTNFVLQSNTLTSNADASVTANAATSPDGTANAYRITKTNATDPVYSSKSTSMTVAANTAYTASRFVKYDGYNTTVSLEYNVGANWGNVFWNAQFTVASTGVTVFSQNNCTATVQNFGNGWYRVTATFTTGATISTPTNPSILLRITGGSGVTVLGYGVQLEAGAFATSYIPTTTTSLTRNSDVVSMTGTNFSSWYNASEGTIVTELSGTGSLFGGVTFDDGTTSNTMELLVASSKATGVMLNGGAGQMFVQPANITAGSTNRFSMAYKNNNSVFYANTLTAGTDTICTVPTVNRAVIGWYPSSAASYLNGHMKKIFYYNLRVLNAEAQAFTK